MSIPDLGNPARLSKIIFKFPISCETRYIMSFLSGSRPRSHGRGPEGRPGGRSRGQDAGRHRGGQGEEQRMQAKLANDTGIAQAKRDFDLKKASYDVEVNTAKAEAELAYELQVIIKYSYTTIMIFRSPGKGGSIIIYHCCLYNYYFTFPSKFLR